MSQRPKSIQRRETKKAGSSLVATSSLEFADRNQGFGSHGKRGSLFTATTRIVLVTLMTLGAMVAFAGGFSWASNRESGALVSRSAPSIPDTLAETRQEQKADDETPQELLETIVELAKQHSVYRSNVDWTKLATKARLQLGNGKSVEELAVPVQEMLYELGDYHGAILIQGQRFAAMRQGKELPRVRKKGFPLVVKEVQKVYSRSLTDQSTVLTGMLEGDIAYVEIPAINAATDQINARALQVRNAIENILERKPKGLIVDLRTNLGGNMHPMFAGLGSVFPNLKLGGQSNDGKTIASTWSIRNGNVFLDDMATTSLSPVKNPAIENLPVAVLIGRYTSSSGEAVASGLNGQTNVRLFGEHTAGYSTSNDWFSLSDDVVFSPAVGYFVSQDKSVHIDGITPQVEIEELLDLENLTSGETIDAAIGWLQKTSRAK